MFATKSLSGGGYRQNMLFSIRDDNGDELPDDLNALKAMVLSREAENARLRQIIKELQRHRFGRRAETLLENQLLNAVRCF
ncbi:hypothetical protein AS026_37675 [Rhizobium altiplani]|uniref:Transposase TnpC homeodomain domain-containing protein n=1 Tax=Rhizobium altiplani TaxID=1864509 RepID=A0A109JUE0_9HYPH|nr:hypothetical protein AS026_37675 [Rhizobium altiplani]